jgi:hypothetical protein
MSEKAFWGQRTTTYAEAKAETLGVCFSTHNIYPVVVAGRVAQHLHCGLLEAETLLERMVEDGSLRYASSSEARRAGLSFGYVVKSTASEQQSA